jgi:hypothetical protein
LTRPPVFFQLGHSPSQLQNFFTVANRDTPGPISLIKVNAVNSLIPSISVKSSPTTGMRGMGTYQSCSARLLPRADEHAETQQLSRMAGSVLDSEGWGSRMRMV